ADLLICRAALAALSANFDRMIEHWAEDRRVLLQGALTGQEVIEFASVSNPLLKFHGCLQRAQKETLWTQKQLADPKVQERLLTWSEWMNLILPGKHLVVVGFWTDWNYLNDVLAKSFTVASARAVTVIDPLATADLQVKAPALWSRLTSLSAEFHHVQ